RFAPAARGRPRGLACSRRRARPGGAGGARVRLSDSLVGARAGRRSLAAGAALPRSRRGAGGGGPRVGLMSRVRWLLAAALALVAFVATVQALRTYVAHQMTVGVLAVGALAVTLAVGLGSLGWA